MRRALVVVAGFLAAWLPAQTAGAANSPTFRDCAHSLGIDPDFVQLSGATVGPGGTLSVTSSQPSVSVEASESSLPGDNLNKVKLSVMVTPSGGAAKTVSGMGTGKVTLTVPLSGAKPGGQYTLDWSATFDSGTHACPGSVDPMNPTSNPFVLHVGGGSGSAHFGGVSFAHHKARVHSRAALVRLACPSGTSGSCHGRLSLMRGHTVVGRASFTISPGKSSTIRVKLSHGALRKLARSHHLTVTGLAVASDNAGHTATTSAPLQLIG